MPSGCLRLQHDFAGHKLTICSSHRHAWHETEVITSDAVSAPHLRAVLAMDQSQGTADVESPCASVHSLNDDVLRKILMLLPQDDRCHVTQQSQSSQTSGLATP